MDKVLFLCNVTMGTFCHSIQLTYNLGFFFTIFFLPGSEYNSYMNHQTFQFLFFWIRICDNPQRNAKARH